MAEPVEWSADGTPRSARFGDIYRSSAGALEQARQVFLDGCGLPSAWRGQPHWTVLEAGFGLGLNFLATWHAWRADPQRCERLHFVSLEAFPVAADDLLRGAAAHPELGELASELSRSWWGLVPGVHRLAFEQGRVQLTLAIGEARAMLPELSLAADSVFLDGFDPQRNPAMWELPLLKAVARCCRRGTALATWTVAGQVRRDLQQCGFGLEKVPGLPPKRECLRGHFDPSWSPRHPVPERHPIAADAVVIGGGLAGAAAAAALAQRGWRVKVLDAAEQPASGASGLPAGLLAPHTSPDDNLLSRLSRAGVRLTLEQARMRLREGADYAWTGVRERRPVARPLPDLGPWQDAWQRPDASGAIWHAAGAWIRPAALVAAWLAQPGVSWHGGARAAALRSDAHEWTVLDPAGTALAWAPLVVIAAAKASAPLVGDALMLHAVRGQVSWGLHRGELPLPPQPVNGNGHFLPDVPLPQGHAWLGGSTYVRGDEALEPRPAEHEANLDRLRTLVPDTAAALAGAFAGRQVQAWTGLRCASTDRRPLVGELQPGLWVSTAMGSRGLTFAWLCAELLAARLHGEPWPLPARLAAALDARRQFATRASAAQP